MGSSFEKTDLLLLLVLLCKSSAHVLTCHCLNGARCHSNGYCENGCEKGWFGPGCQVGNVALNKETMQSSTNYDRGYNYSFNSSRAVDGSWPRSYNVDNGAVFCSHTVPSGLSRSLQERSAWWLVVLDTTHSYVITNITIINRQDGAASRLTNFLIMYSNEVEGDPETNSSKWHKFAQELGRVGNKKTYTSPNTTVAKRVAVYLTAYHVTDSPGNPKAILTLCEVQIYGYQEYDCPNGFTGPGCLLRSCDACESNGGKCTGEYGSCRYDVCPDRSLRAPECWITLSNYSGANIRATATCNSLLFSIDLPDTKPNVAASRLLLQVSQSADGQMVLNKTISVQGTNAPPFKFNHATMYTSYKVSVIPMYCSDNSRCFDATSSRVFLVWTGKREYTFSHNSSCVVVHVTSTTPECETPSAIQVTCESTGGESDTVSSLTSTVCGLRKGREYNCSASATINAKTIEKQSAYIKTELLHASPASKKYMAVVAGSIGASVAVLVVVAVVIVVVVHRRRQGIRKSGVSAVAQDSKTNAHAVTSALNVTMLPTSCDEQTDHTYMSLHVEHGLPATGDYASLDFTS